MSLVRENGNEVETELLDTSLCFSIVMLWLLAVSWHARV